MRVLVDSNIIISAALFPAGKVSSVLSYILETHTVVIPSYSIQECKAVFKKKFPEKLMYLEMFFKKIEYERFETPPKIDSNDFPYIGDPFGLPILASAILSDVDILMTGDKDFDCINIKRPLIMTPDKYYSLYSSA